MNYILTFTQNGQIISTGYEGLARLAAATTRALANGATEIKFANA